MADDYKSIKTDAGLALDAQLSALCKPIKITGAAVGSGKATSGKPLASLNQLVAPINGASALLADIKYMGGAQWAIVVQVSNGERAEGFELTEIGIYAENLEGGKTLLVYLPIYNHPEYIQPMRDKAPLTIREYTALLVTANADQKVVAVLSPAALVARQTLDDALAKQRHTMEQVNGLIADQNRQDSDIATLNARISAGVNGGTEIWVNFDDTTDWVMEDGVWDAQTQQLKG